MRGGRWIALAVLPALLLATDIFYWRLAESRLRTDFEVWAIRSKAAGWDVRHGAITTGGWPDSATLRVDDLTVHTANVAGRGALTWGSDAVVLRRRLVSPDVVEITPVGLHPLQPGLGPAIPVSADHFHVRLTLRQNEPPRAVDIDAVTLTATIPGLGVIGVGHLSGHADLRTGNSRDQAALTFSVSAQPVSLPDGVHWGLGPEIGEIALEGVLNGPSPLWSPGGGGLTARATSWRDEGGSLELRRLSINWGTARLDATATLALDEDLQPMGAGAGKIAGYDAALDALAANAVLTRSAVQAAKAVLSLLANTPADDQPEEVEVPLTLQFRTLSMRQVPLVRLPELEWPEH
jgi:hypothetical protein